MFKTFSGRLLGLYCRETFAKYGCWSSRRVFFEVLEVEFLCGVVRLDVFVGGGVFRVSLEGLAHAGEVARELVCEHFLVGGHFGIELFDFRCEGGGHFNERFVGSAQMLLLLREDGIFFPIEFGLLLLSGSS